MSTAAAPQITEKGNDYVVPELQRRRLFRTEYTGNTLRDHLGLSALSASPAGRIAEAVA